MPLTDRQRELCETSPFDFTDLGALFVNCTLKPSPALSHTQGLIDVPVAIMEANGVAVDQFRAVDHDLAPGTIPPQADAGWIGEAGPGPSYLDPGSGGPENDFTQRNTTFMTWNLLHLARLLKDAGGVPAHGNQRSEFDAGCRFDHPNPDYR